MKYDNKDKVLQLLHGVEIASEKIDLLDELLSYISEESFPNVYIKFGRAKGLISSQEIDISNDLLPLHTLILSHKAFYATQILMMKRSLKSL